MITVLRFLFLTLIFCAPTALAQKDEEPKAKLFADFGKIGVKEIGKKTQKLRNEIAKRATQDTAFGVRVVFYYGRAQTSSASLENLVLNSLYENCYEYMRSTHPGITIVRAGRTDEDRVKFWIIPKGAEVPSP